MGLLSRLFGYDSRRPARSEAAVDTLVNEPAHSETRLGAAPRIAPWAASRLASIFRTYAAIPSGAALQEARLARQCLSQFWLTAPVDQLEVLYRSPIGECHQLLLAGPLSRESLLPDEQQWRDTIAQRLLASFDRPETTNLLLAVMPYFAPGKMRVAHPLQQVPRWLLEDYARLFDPELLQQRWQPAGLLGPAGASYGPAPRLGVQSRGQERPTQSPGIVEARQASPQLSRQRGNEALSLVLSDDFQNRMTGLINLHVIDPSDGEVVGQLVELRRLLGQIWLDAPLEQMELLYDTRFGELYRNLLSSGFPKTPVNPEDQQLRRQLAQFVADMSQPGAINALLAVLPFYPPGKVSFAGGEQHMPVWLVREIAAFHAPQSSEGEPREAQPAATGETPST